MTVSGVAQGTGTMDEHSLTWIFVVGMIFAFLDAFGIGANDVANRYTYMGKTSVRATWCSQIMLMYLLRAIKSLPVRARAHTTWSGCMCAGRPHLLSNESSCSSSLFLTMQHEP